MSVLLPRTQHTVASGTPAAALTQNHQQIQVMCLTCCLAAADHQFHCATFACTHAHTSRYDQLSRISPSEDGYKLYFAQSLYKVSASCSQWSYQLHTGCLCARASCKVVQSCGPPTHYVCCCANLAGWHVP